MASIKRRPDGVWRARYRDAAGREHAKHFKRRVDAQRWLDETTTSIVSGIWVDPNAGRISFSAWFKHWAALQVWAPGTLEAAERAAVEVPFGDVAMNRLTAEDFQGWIRSMRERKLADSTIKMRFSYVHMAVRAAVGSLIQRDPSALARRGGAPGVTLPRQKRAEAAMTIPTAAQVASLYRASVFFFRPFVAVCAFAGLRLGEAAGLQLGDVDFLGRTVSVARQVQGQTRGQARVCDPKAGSSRTIAAPDELLEILSEHVRTVGVMGEEQWLFTPDGERLFNRNSAGNRWREARAKAGVEEFTLHDLRHFYASGLIASGCDVVTVQRALGHSTPSITLNTYSHLWPDANDRTRAAAAGLVASVLKPADSARTIRRKPAVG